MDRALSFSTAVIMEELKKLLQRDHRISIVFFNESGEWVLSHLSGYDKAMMRDEILKEDKPVEVEKPKSEEKKKKK